MGISCWLWLKRRNCQSTKGSFLPSFFLASTIAFMFSIVFQKSPPRLYLMYVSGLAPWQLTIRCSRPDCTRRSAFSFLNTDRLQLMVTPMLRSAA